MLQQSRTLRRLARRSPTFRLVGGLIAVLAAAYVLIVTALWYWQASFIFQPSPAVNTTPSDLGVKFEKVTLPIGIGQLAGWWVPSQDPQAVTLLYSHGNANNIGANAQEVVRFQKAGLNVAVMFACRPARRAERKARRAHDANRAQPLW
jgi:hypothetical protein